MRLRISFTNKKELLMSAAMLVLIALVTMSNGRAGARMIIACAKEYLRKRKKLQSSTTFIPQTFRNTLSRLQNSGLVEREGWGIWKVTKKGREFVDIFMRRVARYEEYMDFRAKKNSGVNTVVIFDIPENQGIKRAQLRFELFTLGFIMVQKSVWVGDGPLPASFIRYLRDVELLSYVRILSVKEIGTL